ncbi:MAG: GGDEF domain-containing protein [Candidatus Moranbacteria bacterium]|nr:GGDEF domain-containing protein [Candidatus Moranbacteria bacterium]
MNSSEETLRMTALLEKLAVVTAQKDSVERDLKMVKDAFDRFAEKALRATQHVGKLEQRVRELEKLSEHDPLTGLLNRRGFNRSFNGEVGPLLRGIHGGGEVVEITALVVDLDDFDLINNDCGHPAGDWVLKKVAELMALHIGHRPGDLLVRLGGDEFCAVLAQASAASADTQAEKFLIALHALREDDPKFFQENRVIVTASIGIATVTLSAGMTVDEVLTELYHNADQALRAAKQLGKNASVRHDAMGTVPAPLGDE